MAAAILSFGGQAQWATVADAMLPAAQASTITMDPADKRGHHIMRSADGLFYTHAMVNGRPVRFLVDTGASTVVLTSADARRVGLALDEGQYNLQLATVGGAASMAWATLDKVALGDHEARNVRAVVVRDGIGVSLMGQNMLTTFNSVTITANGMTIN